ncbi:MAG: prepilin-type N-terminal cleavage/methylation domain-containing protein [Planctomycetota bacterium]|nr:prepilin-type N-terminal cleavage/methylation domain-containing protein [Planctomycetota bacterium]
MMRSSFLHKSRAGFTLVELLVVIAIKVLLDGQPLSGAQVQLLPKGDVALGMHSGSTDATGAFTIVEVASSNTPIRPGAYVVLVSKFSVKGNVADLPAGGMGAMVNEVPDIYQDRNATPLTIEIQSAKTKLPPFELNSTTPSS